MIFIIPIILGAAALATAAFGVGAGVSGVSNLNEAGKIGKDAEERHRQAVKQLKTDWEVTQELAEAYGQLQINIKVLTIGRFVDFIQQIGRRSSESEMEFLSGLEGISVQQLKEYETTVMEAKEFAQGGLLAVGAATAAGQGAVSLVGLFGTASTGTAIAGLSGAAAWNATLAWLGGGSLAAGGGGMALGTLVLGGITVGPALAIGGFVLASQGEKALTTAREYEAKVNIDIAKIDTAKCFLQQVRQRITEFKNLLEDLNNRASLGLDELNPKEFEPNRDASKFQQVALLVKALVEIMKTPVLNSEGNLNSETVIIKAKYSAI